MQRKPVNLKKRIVLEAGLAACAACTGWLLWTAWRETLLAAYWENELMATAGKEPAASSAAAADETIGRLLELGEPGLSATVRALGDPRDEVGRMAWRALDQLVSCYENGPADEAVARLETLAIALADDIDKIPPGSRPRAAKLAMRIVVCLQKASPFDSGIMPAFDAERVIAACDRVLRASDSKVDSMIGSTEELGEPAARRETENPQKEVVHARTVLPADHSMYLELAELAPPALPRVSAKNDAQPRLLLSTEAKPLPKNASAGTSHAATVSDDRASERGESGANAPRLHEMDPLDLFGRLNESDDAQAAAAELAVRGFSPRQIDVGRHLVSRDAAERLRWAEVLPGIRGIDARYWLLRLSHDTNVQVRRAAVSLLATDRDPEVIRRLRQIAVEETDSALRDQASRALEILDADSETGP